MADMKFSISQIKELMDKLASSNLGKVSLKDGNYELKIEAKQALTDFNIGVSAGAEAEPAAKCTLEEVKSVSTNDKTLDGKIVKSPIVGTFYASSSPEKPPYVQVGSKVKKGDVLFVIESMKLMNEIQSNYDGVISEILVEDAQGVEYNQPIMVIE